MSGSAELGQIAAVAADDLIGRSSAFVGAIEPDRELVGVALSKIAEAGLFNLGYLNSDTEHISAEDMNRAVSAVTALAARSLSLATIYMVNAIFGGAFVAQIANPQQMRQLLPECASAR